MESKAVLLTGYSGKKEGFGAVCLSRNQENHEPCEWLEGWRKRRFFKRARGATAKCNVDDKWRVETRCQNDGTAEGNDMIVRWTRRMFAVLRFPPSIPGPVEGPSYLPLTDLALLLSSLSLSLFPSSFFFIYIHTPPSAISRCDSTSLTSTTTNHQHQLEGDSGFVDIIGFCTVLVSSFSLASRFQHVVLLEKERTIGGYYWPWRMAVLIGRKWKIAAILR